MNKQFLISISVVGVLLLTAIAMLIPWYHLAMENADAAKSLASLKAAGESISSFENEYGFLPTPERWVNAANKYSSTEKITDPVYRAITGEAQPETPGWGMNTKLSLSTGSPNKDPIGIKTYQFPSDAVLLAPSFTTTISPNRDGSLPAQPISKKNNTLVEHGKRLGSIGGKYGISGLYLLTGGEIVKMTPQAAAEKLKIRALPESEEVAALEKIEAAENAQELEWQSRSKIEKKDDYLVLRHGEINTPFLPVSTSKSTTISMEIGADTPTKYIPSVEYHNKFKYVVNTTQSNATAQLTQHYPQWNKIVTDKDLNLHSGETLGFNPYEGHACNETTVKRDSERVPDGWQTPINPTDAQYKKGTVVTGTTYLGQKETKEVESGWTTWEKTINPQDCPAFSKYIQVHVENPTSHELRVRNIKIKREVAPTKTP